MPIYLASSKNASPGYSFSVISRKYIQKNKEKQTMHRKKNIMHTHLK